MPSARRKNAKRRKLIGKQTYAGTTAYKQRIEEMHVNAIRAKLGVHGHLKS